MSLEQEEDHFASNFEEDENDSSGDEENEEEDENLEEDDDEDDIAFKIDDDGYWIGAPISQIPQENDSNDVSCSKIGGNPVWLLPAHPNPCCEMCGSKMLLVSQSYAPLDDDSDRVLYIFACNRAQCSAKSVQKIGEVKNVAKNWQVWRATLKIENHLVAPQVKKEEVKKESKLQNTLMKMSQDWSDEEEEKEKEKEGITENKVIEVNKVEEKKIIEVKKTTEIKEKEKKKQEKKESFQKYETEEEYKKRINSFMDMAVKTSASAHDDLMDLNLESKLNSLLSANDGEEKKMGAEKNENSNKKKKQKKNRAFPCFPLDIFEEPEGDEDEGIEKSLIKKVQNLASKSTGDDELDQDLEKVQESAHDKAIYFMSRRMSRCPHQVIRWKFNGTPMWVKDERAHHQKSQNHQHIDSLVRVDPPVCEKCGHKRVFELQIMSTTVFFLKPHLFNQDDEGLDFGTAVVYSCGNKDCGLGSYQRDVVFVQEAL